VQSPSQSLIPLLESKSNKQLGEKLQLTKIRNSSWIQNLVRALVLALVAVGVTAAPSLAAPNVPPTLVEAGIAEDGVTLTLTFSEPVSYSYLSGSNKWEYTTVSPSPTTTGFTLNVEGAMANFDAVAVSGNTIQLTLETKVFAGQNATLTYAGTNTQSVSDKEENSAQRRVLAAITTPLMVTNLSDEEPPISLLEAELSASGDEVTLSFSEAVSYSDSLPSGSDSGFELAIDGSETDSFEVTLVAGKIVLSLNKTVMFDSVVSVSYVVSANEVISEADPNLKLPSFGYKAVENNSVQIELVPEADVSANGRVITLSFSEAVSFSGPLPMDESSGLTLTVDEEATGFDVTLEDGKVILTLDVPVLFGIDVTLSYTVQAESKVVVSGSKTLELVSFGDLGVTNDSVQVSLLLDAAVSVSGEIVELSFSETVSYSDSLPAGSESGFVLKINSMPTTSFDVTLEDGIVVLILDTTVLVTDKVSISYTAPMGSKVVTELNPTLELVSFGDVVVDNKSLETGPPSVPTSVSAVAGNGVAALTWTAPVSDGGSSISEYRIEYSTDSETWVSYSSTTSGTSLSVTGLVNGKTYSFRVLAVNGDDKVSQPSTPSNIVTPSAPALQEETGPDLASPSAPRSVSAVAGSGSATVSWLAPLANGGSVITGYKVQYSTNSGVNWTAVPGTVTGTTTLVTGLVNGTPYVFRVIAINAIGESPASTPSIAVSPVAPEPISQEPTTSSPVVIPPEVKNPGAGLGRVTFMGNSSKLTVASFGYLNSLANSWNGKAALKINVRAFKTGNATRAQAALAMNRVRAVLTALRASGLNAQITGNAGGVTSTPAGTRWVWVKATWTE
jgi:uncharacterized repeat protein (TIGR02059 family)